MKVKQSMRFKLINNFLIILLKNYLLIILNSHNMDINDSIITIIRIYDKENKLKELKIIINWVALLTGVGIVIVTGDIIWDYLEYNYCRNTIKAYLETIKTGNVSEIKFHSLFYVPPKDHPYQKKLHSYCIPNKDEKFFITVFFGPVNSQGTVSNNINENESPNYAIKLIRNAINNESLIEKVNSRSFFNYLINSKKDWEFFLLMQNQL